MRAKAQLAIEFIVMAGIALIITVMIVAGVGNQIGDLAGEKEIAALQDIAYAVRIEISTAANTQHGYSRTFKLPDNLDGVEYSLDVQGTTLIATSENYEFAVRIPSVNGNLVTGTNIINNTYGKVYLN